jgi:transketolase
LKQIERLKEIASQIRRDILRMTNKAKSGHPGGSLGCADLFSVLFFEELQIDPQNFSMDGIDEDLFFLSNGHISPVLYSALAHRGYFPKSELATFRKLSTRLQGHPTTMEGLPGIRIATGSLGQGLSVAAGAALAKKLNNDNHIVYVLTGDGELQEGQNWEALMFAAQHKVDNLIAFVDYNQKQIDGPLDEVIGLGNLRAKLESFGWKVLEMDGNNVEDILNTINQAKKELNKEIPVVIIMKTIMGKGVDFMEDDHKWHGVPPNDEELDKALTQIKETIGDF